MSVPADACDVCGLPVSGKDAHEAYGGCIYCAAHCPTCEEGEKAVRKSVIREPQEGDPQVVIGRWQWAILAPSGQCATRVQPNGQRMRAMYRNREPAEKAAPDGYVVVEAAYLELLGPK